MINLSTYITEALTFAELDKELEGLEPDMVALKQAKILSKKFLDSPEIDSSKEQDEFFWKIMDEIEKHDNTSYTKICQVKKEIGDDDKSKVAGYIKYFKTIFSVCEKMYKKEWITSVYLLNTVLALIEYSENYGFYEKSNYKDVKAPEKLDKMFGKMVAKLNDKYEISIDSKYKFEKEKLVKANYIYKSIQFFKDDFKNHKYLIVTETTDSSVTAYFMKTDNYKSFDDAIKTRCNEVAVINKGFKKKIDGILKYMGEGKEALATLSTSTYYIDNNKDYPLPLIGYLDIDIDTNTEMMEYSGYDHKERFAGRISDKNYVCFKDGDLHYSDSLWSVHKK